MGDIRKARDSSPLLLSCLFLTLSLPLYSLLSLSPPPLLPSPPAPCLYLLHPAARSRAPASWSVTAMASSPVFPAPDTSPEPLPTCYHDWSNFPGNRIRMPESRLQVLLPLPADPCWASSHPLHFATESPSTPLALPITHTAPCFFPTTQLTCVPGHTTPHSLLTPGRSPLR